VISAVIPCYNEEGCVVEFSHRLFEALIDVADVDFEIIFMVGGTDGTMRLLTDEWHGIRQVRIVYERERGLGTALRKGFALVDSRSEYVLTMDADLQQLPEEIWKLLMTMEFGWFDAVIGRHGNLQDGRPRSKKFISKAVNVALRVFYQVRLHDFTSDFRLYRTDALLSILDELVGKDYQTVPEIVIRMKRNGYGDFGETDINFPSRRTGKSKLEMIRALRGYLKLLWRLR
jgi:undecaprenyl-phosphate 4-deoxy-4-formamido-L-arabinose transferase